jgi:negative regulator of flagellin synthesis FlgM
MNIKGVTSLPVNELKTQENKQKHQLPVQSATKEATANPEKPGESLQLSNEAQDIRKLEQNLAKLPEVNQERVDEIKQAIANGEYEIDSRNVAEKLLGLEQDF